jgi:hypothetical protein
VSNVILLLALVVVVWFVIALVQRRRRGLVAERGTSVGADLGTMNDQPRVRVSTVSGAGPDRVRVVLRPADGDEPVVAGTADTELVVFLREDEVGFETLEDWKRRQAALAIVMVPGNELVRLRSVDDLQPLTLRRVTEA